MKKIFAIAQVVLLEMLRRKDVYVLFILTAAFTLLLGSVNIFGEGSVVRYLKEFCLALIWLAMLGIAVLSAARQIPAERESRTLFPLLAKPLTRAQIVLGKFLGCWLACGISLLCFYGLFALITGSREHIWPWLSYGQAVWLHWVFCAVVIALTLLGSLIFAAPSSNSVIVFLAVAGSLMLGRHLRKVALQIEGLAGGLLEAVYFIWPHLEFFDVRDLITHNWPPLPATTIVVDTLYGAAYTGAFLLLACWIFRRKPVV